MATTPLETDSLSTPTRWWGVRRVSTEHVWQFRSGKAARKYAAEMNVEGLDEYQVVVVELTD